MSSRSVAELSELTRAGKRVKFLYFWGHQPQRDGSIGSSCLSQWWPSPFNVDGRTYHTAEHWMMWSKADLFDDTEMAQQILEVRHPRQAKTLGRKVRGFNQARWESERDAIVLAGTVAKFSQHQNLKAYLLGTGDRVPVEASPMDRIWGIGLAADDPRAADPTRWRGLNLLGFALIGARDIIRKS